MPLFDRLKRLIPRTRGGRLRVFLYGLPVIALAADLALVRFWRHIPVRPDTTVITAPLAADGMPDYVAWMDARLKDGVTPENNAALVLLQVEDPSRLSSGWREGAGRALGVAIPAHPAEPYLSRSRLFDRLREGGLSADAANAEASRIWEVIFRRPWNASEFPPAAAWLAENEQTFQRIHAALQRPRYYLPLLDAAGQRPRHLREVYPAADALSSSLFILLRARLQLRIGEGDHAGARQDLADLYRLGALHGPENDYQSNGTKRWAAPRAVALAQSMPVTGLRDLLAILSAASSSMISSPDLSNDWWRFMELEKLQYAAAHGIGPGLEWAGNTNQSWYYTTGAIGSLLSSTMPIDYPGWCRTVNGWYDHRAAAAKLPTYREQRSAEQAAYHPAGARDADYRLPFFHPARLLAGVTYSEDAYSRTQAAEVTDLATLAVALAGHRAEHGAYPDRLHALVPAWLPSVPIDRFNDEPLHYRKTADGYVLYSVGPDLKDDRGGLGDCAVTVTAAGATLE
jgi:hypothetical protein